MRIYFNDTTFLFFSKIMLFFLSYKLFVFLEPAITDLFWKIVLLDSPPMNEEKGPELFLKNTP